MLKKLPTFIFLFSKTQELLAGCPGRMEKVMGISFVLDGQEFQALNGGPKFKFTEAISMFVRAETQAEIDDLWERLSAGGEKSRCGWLKDKFGLSWQVVPPILGQLLSDKDSQKANRVMMAMLKMDKLDIQTLKDAYNAV
jgi:predicted 3-demethylubiquinone-9 3-methyltransferase (glyoxalase superfamily)